MIRRAACILALATPLMLSACGFQLRGSGDTALPFKSIYVGLPENSALGSELKRYIRADDHTQVVSDPKAAQVILDVLSESREKAILSLNTQGRIREYTLYYKLRFRVRDGQNKELIAPTDITLKRDISFNESAVMAKENEEALLYRDMQSDLVQQLLRRLHAIKSA
ncbi:LPS-assembly lipoprotein LptE [Noviherbaspirillum autotrophicum]|uniref:LPS-assembly lipoprotein LptE n=1 Tax=Noviherbaspirillum autotrophicum TaxID=709839 RepID=A0A0C2BUQ5_9BURK|nr:lipoprotein [Noviherbaspirillum autotrophicum]